MSTPLTHADSLVFDLNPSPAKRKKLLPIKQQSVFQALLVGEAHSELIVYRPLPINIETDDDGTIVVSDDIFLVYGYGKDALEALNDYVASLIEFYWILQDGADTNPFDNKQYSYLQKFIQPKSLRGFYALQATRD